MSNVDVLIVGAGSAGATAAWQCRRHDLRVCLVDAKSRERAGAWWINGVESRLFDDLQLAAQPPVVFHAASVFHVESPGGQRISCRSVPTVEVHMGHLNEHLLSLAEEHGAELWFDSAVESLVIENGVVRGARIRRDGKVVAVRARLVVDATGVAGHVRSKLPASLWEPEPVPDSDLCVAAQQIREIEDMPAARAFLEANRLEPGELLCWACLDGGYSILNVGVDLDHGIVTLLTGAMRARGQQAALRLIELGVERLGFIKNKQLAGAGLIPVRRAFDRLVGEGFALLGTAACQVFPAHGSGVAAGMRAAEMLARVAAAALSRGQVADTASMWPYAAEYQRGRGALCASQELVRRMSEALEPDDLDALLASGAINEHAINQSLGCLPLRLSLGQIAGAGRAALKSPRLAGRVLGTAAKAALVNWHYQRYPQRWDPTAFMRWRRRTARLFR